MRKEFEILFERNDVNALKKLTYYQLLNVDKTLNDDDFLREVSAKYRRLALRFHPDHNKGDLEKAEVFKLINEAYSTLLDREERAKYDADLAKNNDTPFFESSIFESVRRPVKNPIVSIVVSPCGNYIASVTETGRLSVSNAISGDHIATYDTKKLHDFCSDAQRYNIAFSCDSKKIVVVGHRDNYLSEVNTVENRVTNHEIFNDSDQCSIKRIFYAENGNLIVTNGSRVRIFCGQNKTFLRYLISIQENILVSAFDFASSFVNGYRNKDAFYRESLMFPDGVRMALLSECRLPRNDGVVEWLSRISILNTNTGKCLLTFENFKHYISVMAVSNDAKYFIAGSSEGWIGIWNMQQLSRVGRFDFWGKPEASFLTFKTHTYNHHIAISDDNQHFIIRDTLCDRSKQLDRYSHRFALYKINTGELLYEKIVEYEKNVQKDISWYPSAWCNQGDVIALGYQDGSIRKFKFSDFMREAHLLNLNSDAAILEA